MSKNGPGPPFEACRGQVPPAAWDAIVETCRQSGEAFARCLEENRSILELPPYLPDLARIEWARHRAACAEPPLERMDAFTVNPTLQVLKLSWNNLAPFVSGKEPGVPSPKEELVLVWRDPGTAMVHTEAAGELDLLALKITAEGIDPEEAAAEAGRSSGLVDMARWRAARRGILLAPPSRIRRPEESWPAAARFSDRHLVSQGFTLQWHITQACDLHCRHCYDRTSRTAIPFDSAVNVLEDLLRFCRRRRVSGHVTFTGGNPLLHPRFFDLYREASERGFTISILGNPTERVELQKITAIERPTNYQVSLEGLEERNDAIRGEGHFRSVMDFLPLLREMNIPSMAMLTLTADNIDEVIPLARSLEGVVDSFFFNRLAAVGEGAALTLPGREKYASFLRSYLAFTRQSPIAGLKDNLFNIVLEEEGLEPFGGCTGFGCGAAFNFLTLLAEGEAHGCRKFPSPLGNVLDLGIEGVYESEAARRYREGCRDCRECRHRPVCGGCLAVAYGQGLDPAIERDPHCFVTEEGR